MENNLYEVLALFAGLVLLYSVFAGAVERTWISGPMVFIAVGLLVGPLGLNLVPFEIDRETLSTLAELTLALVLFTDAAGADLKALRGAIGLPVRLLLVGLPLTIVLDAHLPNSDTLAMMVACTVILSVVAHGVTANPWARAYGLRASGAGKLTR